MHPQIKHARFNLIVCVVTAVLVLAAYIIFLHVFGPHRARGAFGFFGILGMLGLGPVFYHQRPGKTGVVIDERDKQIGDRAQIIAWRVVMLFTTVACMAPWVWVVIRSGLDTVAAPYISVEWPPWFLMSSVLVFYLAWSVAILVYYRRGEPKGDE